MSVDALQAWFARHCDGDWEHQGGVSIDTLDNPGWIVRVQFNGMPHQFDIHIASDSYRNSETDWMSLAFEPTGDMLQIACGPKLLKEAIARFFAGTEEAG